MIRYVFYCRFDTTTSSLSIYQRLRCFEVVTENYQEKQNVNDSICCETEHVCGMKMTKHLSQCTTIVLVSTRVGRMFASLLL